MQNLADIKRLDAKVYAFLQTRKTNACASLFTRNESNEAILQPICAMQI